MARKRWLLFLLVAAGGVGLFLMLKSPAEPYYHGQPLSYWILKLSYGTRKEEGEARDAVRAMGPSAVPYLTAVLKNEDSSFKLKILRNYGSRFPALYRWFSSTIYQQQCAAHALGELGPAASKAIPALEQMGISGSSTSTYRKAALMKIKGESIKGLILILDDPNLDTSGSSVALNQERSASPMEAFLILGEYGTNAQAAIPSLCRALRSSRYSSFAATAIGHIHSQPEIAVPALIDSIKRGEQVPNSFWALGKFENEAAAAIPIIRQYIKDAGNNVIGLNAVASLYKILPPEERKNFLLELIRDKDHSKLRVTAWARHLLGKIDPEAAKKAGD